MAKKTPKSKKTIPAKKSKTAQELESPKSQTSKKKIEKTKNVGKIYKLISLSFVGLVIVLSLVIFFISSAKTTIIIQTKDIDVKTESKLEIVLSQEVSNPDQLTGKLLETTLSLEKTYSIQNGETQEAQATGEVTIINNYSKSQTLVETTRLLSECGTLFRLKETISVPSGGQVKAKIYADKPGVDGEIATTKFSIPGLWEGLRPHIYAVSEEPTTGGQQTIGTLTQQEIDEAINKTKEEAFTEGLSKLTLEMASELTDKDYQIKPDLVSQEILSQKINHQAEDTTSEFTVFLETKLTTVSISEDEIFETIRKKLILSTPQEYELIKINRDGFSYSLENYDQSEEKIEVLASLSGKGKLIKADEIINKSEITGLTRNELDDYFKKLDHVIENARYEFSPFWLKHSATNEEKIKLIIN